MSRRTPDAWVFVAAGALWLGVLGASGTIGLVVAVIPGVLLLGPGLSILLWSDADRRPVQFAALGASLGILLAAPGALIAGPWSALLLLVVSGASFLASGSASLRLEPPTPDAPVRPARLGLAARVALDEAVLANTRLSAVVPHPGHQRRMRDEIEETLALFRERGWLEKPDAYHVRPPPLDRPTIRPARALRAAFERVEFESGYEARVEEPGRERWLTHARNLTAHASLLRHRAGPRPWLICVHGYRMGFPLTDLGAFEAHRLHRDRGLNVICPVLPLHGPRSTGWRSGDGYLTGDFVDLVHAEAQAIWDLRRIVRWIRSEGATAVGIYGLSLGGYTAALLAALEEDLACVVAGVPATDLADLMWRHASADSVRQTESVGLTRPKVAQLLTVVSPLALRPKIPRERRFIFAGTADRLTPPDQSRRLWEHWERPAMAWYPGGHLTFRREPRVRSLLAAALDGLEEAG